MKAWLRPIPIGALVVIAVLVATNHAMFAVAAVLVLIMSVALSTMKVAGRNRAQDAIALLDPASRARIAPLRKSLSDIEQAASVSTPNSPEKVLGALAVTEGQRLCQQAAKALQTRSQLARMRSAAEDNQRRIVELQAMLDGSADAEEKSKLEAALAARREQLRAAEETNRAINDIDRGIESAVETLSALGSQVIGLQSRPETAMQQVEELRARLADARALQLTYSEVEGLEKGQSLN